MNNINITLFILYYILLFCFFKFNIFKKHKDSLGFRGFFFIGIITAIVFFINCYNIVYNSNFIFGFNAESRTVRLTFLLLFITTFFTIIGLFVSDYFRKESDKKDIIQGFKGLSGPRGKRGMNKMTDVCDENVCSEKICNKKVMQIISDAYTYIMKKKGITPVHSGSQIQNKYLINKVNLLCDSPQFLQLNEEKNENEIYGSYYGNSEKLTEEDVYGKDPKDDGIIRSTWIKWLKIILKYEKGHEFLESEYLVDNDFDNMITEQDKLKSENFEPSPSPGTPSEGKESPFDEIKKFDMWYWGEKKESMINVQYFCDTEKYKNSSDYKPVLNKLDSNQYKNIWRSSIAYQSVNNNEFIPFQNKGSKKISIYRPEVIETDEGIFKPLGDIVLEGDIDSHKKTSVNQVFPKNKLDINFKPNLDGDPSEKTQLISGDIKSPDGFKKLYASKRTKGVGINKYGYSFWKPYSKDPQYRCLGYALDNGVTLTPPNKNLFACVPKKCTKLTNPINLNFNFWNSSQPGSDKDLDKDKQFPLSDKPLKINNYTNKDKDTSILRLLQIKEEDSENTDEEDANSSYILIPKGDEGSCFDNELSNTFNDSKWIVEEKNDPDYSIHSHFNDANWKSE